MFIHYLFESAILLLVINALTVRSTMENQIDNRINLYQRTVIFSLLFTLMGFSYNVWRMEVSENNNNIRTASFEMLINLSSLEQLVYSAYYDEDLKEGNPRKGWVIVGLIDDLSVLTDDEVKTKTTELKDVWSVNWETIATSQQTVDNIVGSIDSVREEIKILLNSLD
ncbi:hypothetical protein CXF79_10700 [Colwellia sp. Bg11-28]|nr:hypothetical protein CXF79_10700 [Colwellia sp. Bg11-28]